MNIPTLDGNNRVPVAHLPALGGLGATGVRPAATDVVDGYTWENSSNGDITQAIGRVWLTRYSTGRAELAAGAASTGFLLPWGALTGHALYTIQPSTTPTVPDTRLRPSVGLYEVDVYMTTLASAASSLAWWDDNTDTVIELVDQSAVNATKHRLRGQFRATGGTPNGLVCTQTGSTGTIQWARIQRIST